MPHPDTYRRLIALFDTTRTVRRQGVQIVIQNAPKSPGILILVDPQPYGPRA